MPSAEPPPLASIRWRDSHRLIPSRFPSVGLFDRVATPGDLDAVFELEGWTNDRISAELGAIEVVPRAEWVTGRPMASVVMAAFCHPRPGGARFSDETRGAWYAARSLETALVESIFNRSAELEEIGGWDTRVEMRLYLADIAGSFHDIRSCGSCWAPLYSPDDYTASQAFGRRLLDGGSNGVVYRSVRDASGQCVACFRPRLVERVRVGGHFEYRWEGRREPAVSRLAGGGRRVSS